MLEVQKNVFPKKFSWLWVSLHVFQRLGHTAGIGRMLREESTAERWLRDGKLAGGHKEVRHGYSPGRRTVDGM